MRCQNYSKTNQAYFYIVARTLEVHSTDARTCHLSWHVQKDLQRVTGLRAQNISLLIELMRRVRLLSIPVETTAVVVEFQPEFWTLLALFEINSEDLEETLELAA